MADDQEQQLPYWRVSSKVWAHARTYHWTQDVLDMALYLITNPHRSTEGFFRLPPAYMTADLGWAIDRVTSALNALIDEGFCDFDADTDLMLVVKSLKYQRPDNAKQQTHAVRKLTLLPQSRLWRRFLESAVEYAPTFAKSLTIAFPKAFDEAFGKGSAKGYGISLNSSSLTQSQAQAPDHGAARIPPANSTDREQEILSVLRSVEGYPADDSKDLQIIRSLAEEFPTVDVLKVARSWQTAKLDEPLERKSRPRAQLRTWVEHALKWGRDLIDVPRPERPIEQGGNDPPRPADEGSTRTIADEIAERMRRRAEHAAREGRTASDPESPEGKRVPASGGPGVGS